jgi:hypothetical protein
VEEYAEVLVRFDNPAPNKAARCAPVGLTIHSDAVDIGGATPTFIGLPIGNKAIGRSTVPTPWPPQPQWEC